jgi:hypothetical protein
MRTIALRLTTIIATLSSLSFTQVGPVVTTHDLPLLGIVGAGILAGGVLSLLKTRQRK